MPVERRKSVPDRVVVGGLRPSEAPTGAPRARIFEGGP